MGHRVHPKAFRIKEINDWDARGVYQKKFPEYLEGDFKIRRFLKKKLEKASVEKIEIERFPGKINIIISSARPGLIIGRGGGGIEELRKDLGALLKPSLPLEALLNKESKLEIKLEIREIRNPWLSASLSSQWIAQQIERRIPHRRVLKQAMDRISVVKGVEGCRLEIAGRLGGAEIARREWLKRGKMPRQTIRAEIDYAAAGARCTYGIIGVKVWIYKGEKF